MLGPFYSSEVLPPFLVEQASSLQSKPLPCRASLLLAEQASSLQGKPPPCRASFLKLGGQVWAFVLSGARTKDGLYLLWACKHGPVDMGLWTWASWACQALLHISSSSHIIANFNFFTTPLHLPTSAPLIGTDMLIIARKLLGFVLM